MKATIHTQGRQFIVQEGDVLKVNQYVSDTELTVEGKPQVLAQGSKITFDRVLSVGSGETLRVGTPLVAGAVVEGEILQVFKDDKVVTFKRRRRENYRKHKGHRQCVCRVKITGIKA